MKRETLKNILHRLLNLLTRVEYHHLEYVPPRGGIIIATNHLSRLDIPVLLVIPARDDVTALVTDKYKAYPLFKWLVTTANGIWLDRTKADFTAFKAAVEAIKDGQAMGIAPEGTRSQTGGLIEGKSGVVLLALRAGCPIVPVGISGTDTAVADMLKLKRPPIQVTFGPAFTLPPLDRDNREEQLKRYTDEVMCRIAVTLPEKYRGVYREAPRVKELEKELPSTGGGQVDPLSKQERATHEHPARANSGC